MCRPDPSLTFTEYQASASWESHKLAFYNVTIHYVTLFIEKTFGITVVIFRKSVLFITLLIVVNLLLGCSNKPTSPYFVVEKFYNNIKNKEFKQAYNLQIKKLSKEDIDRGLTLFSEQQEIKYEEFKNYYNGKHTYFKKDILKIEKEETSQPDVQRIKYILDNMSGVLVFEFKKRKDNWMIMNTIVRVY